MALEPSASRAVPVPPLAISVKRLLVAPLAIEGREGHLDTIRRHYCELLPAYIEALSYGQVRVEVALAPWIAMPRPLAEYRVRSFRIFELRKDSGPQRRLVTDAAYLLDERYDLSGFDGLMLAVGVDTSELGRAGYLFRSPTGFGRMRLPSGRFTPPTDVHTWNAPLPSIAYAVPKMIAGYRDSKPVAPTLYDYAAQSTPGPFAYGNRFVGGSSNMQYISVHAGPWDILSQHGIHTPEGPVPQGMTSFTRLRLGWIPERAVATILPGERRELLLSPLHAGSGETLAVRLPIAVDRYILVEARRQQGVDRHLPAEGVLVLKVDESIPEGSGPVRVVDAHPEKPWFQAAPFRSGQTFRDAALGIAVSVLGEEGRAFRVVVDRTASVARK